MLGSYWNGGTDFGLSDEERGGQHIIFQNRYGLELWHNCTRHGCALAEQPGLDCGLCRFNPSRRCSRQIKRVVAEHKPLLPECSQRLRVRVVSLLPGDASEVPAYTLQVGIVTEKAAPLVTRDNLDAHRQQPPPPPPGDDQTLMFHWDGAQASVPEHMNGMWLTEVTTAREVEIPADLSLWSTERIFGARKPQAVLVVRAVDGDLVSGMAQPLTAFECGKSNPFRVLTQRAVQDDKPDIPLMTGKVTTIRRVGKGNKLMNMPEAMAKAMSQDPMLQRLQGDYAREVRTVKDLHDLILKLEGAFQHERTAVLQALGIKPSAWEEMKRHVDRAIDPNAPDNRLREFTITAARHPRCDVGLIFKCTRGEVLFRKDSIVGLIKRTGAHERFTPCSCFTPSHQMQAAELLRAAEAAWPQWTHPGWALYRLQALPNRVAQMPLPLGWDNAPVHMGHNCIDLPHTLQDAFGDASGLDQQGGSGLDHHVQDCERGASSSGQSETWPPFAHSQDNHALVATPPLASSPYGWTPPQVAHEAGLPTHNPRLSVNNRKRGNAHLDAVAGPSARARRPEAECVGSPANSEEDSEWLLGVAAPDSKMWLFTWVVCHDPRRDLGLVVTTIPLGEAAACAAKIVGYVERAGDTETFVPWGSMTAGMRLMIATPDVRAAAQREWLRRNEFGLTERGWRVFTPFEKALWSDCELPSETASYPAPPGWQVPAQPSLRDFQTSAQTRALDLVQVGEQRPAPAVAPQLPPFGAATAHAGRSEVPHVLGPHAPGLVAQPLSEAPAFNFPGEPLGAADGAHAGPGGEGALPDWPPPELPPPECWWAPAWPDHFAGDPFDEGHVEDLRRGCFESFGFGV